MKLTPSWTLFGTAVAPLVLWYVAAQYLFRTHDGWLYAVVLFILAGLWFLTFMAMALAAARPTLTAGKIARRLGLGVFGSACGFLAWLYSGGLQVTGMFGFLLFAMLASGAVVAFIALLGELLPESGSRKSDDVFR